MTLLASKADVLAQRLNRAGTSLISSCSLGSLVGVYAIYKTSGVKGHTSSECYNDSSVIEHVSAL